MNTRGELARDNLGKSHPQGMPGVKYYSKRGAEHRTAGPELEVTADCQMTGDRYLPFVENFRSRRPERGPPKINKHLTRYLQTTNMAVGHQH